MAGRDRRDGKELLLLIPLILIIVLLFALSKPRGVGPESVEEPDSLLVVGDTTPICRPLQPFDPNEDDYMAMVAAGVERRVAVSIIRWREAGKVYRIKEDVALCYGMTDSLYAVVEPYIVIGEEYRIRPKRDTLQQRQHKQVEYTKFRIDTASAAYLTTLGFSLRQANLILRYGEIIGGYRSIEEFNECYAVSDDMAKLLEPYIIFPEREAQAYVEPCPKPLIIDINSADSLSLVALSGIGPKSAQHILRYRHLLGGYHSVSQVLELDVVTEDNYARFATHLWCDTTKVVKMDVNRVPLEQLVVHPYLTNRMIRRIINHRELKGDFMSLEEMIESRVFNREEAERIAPYLQFGQDSLY